MAGANATEGQREREREPSSFLPSFGHWLGDREVGRLLVDLLCRIPLLSEFWYVQRAENFGAPAIGFLIRVSNRNEEHCDFADSCLLLHLPIFRVLRSGTEEPQY